eukprot:gene17965-21396_t
MAAAAESNIPFGPGKNNLWTKIIEHNKNLAKQPGGDAVRPDAILYFVGSRQGGKSTLLNRFLYPDKTDTPKATEGLEYTYARKSVSTNIERKDIAHIWEIAGTEKLSNEISACENIFLGMRQVATAVVVIVVDLSNPASVLPTLEYWLDKVKAKTGATYEKLERRGSKLPEQLKLRAKKVFGSSHEDANSVVHTGISLVVAATKYDTFKDGDAEVRKIMSRTLRYFAHTHGAGLVYMGGLQDIIELESQVAEGVVPLVQNDKGQNPKDLQEYRAQLNNFRALLNHLVFTGPDRKITGKVPVETDHMKQICIPSGTDKLKDVGRPRGGGDNAEGAHAEWKAVFEKLYPPVPKASDTDWSFDTEQYAEAVVDSVIQQKNAELAAYKKQQAAQ